ncbi:Dihydrofolate reductase [Bertholletia excelsa]
METQTRKKPRFLCLHGFRTSAEILGKQLSRWPEAVLGKLDLVFLDGPYYSRGKSDVEGFFDPPYYEWFQFSQDFQEYYNFEECLAYIEDYMVKHGPFDGLLGFSQGAILSAALPGMQLKGMALTRVPKIKFVIILSGGKFGGIKFGAPKLAINAFSSPLKCPSLHVIGEADFLKEAGTELVEAFEEPLVIHHPKGHTVARLDEKGLKTALSFTETTERQIVVSYVLIS